MIFFIIIKKKKLKNNKIKPKMQCMNVMQMQTLKKNNFGHKR